MLEDRNDVTINVSKARIKITFSLVRWASVPKGQFSPFKGPYDLVLCRFLTFEVFLSTNIRGRLP